MDHRHTSLTTQGHGGPPRMSDQPNVGATSETAQTWKTIHTKHTLSQTNKAKMEWWWWRPNDIRGPWGSKVSWHLSYRWGKTPKNPHPGNLSRPGIEPGPAAWQARMLPLAPQWWTEEIIKTLNMYQLSRYHLFWVKFLLITVLWLAILPAGNAKDLISCLRQCKKNIIFLNYRS